MKTHIQPKKQGNKNSRGGSRFANEIRKKGEGVSNAGVEDHSAKSGSCTCQEKLH